MNKTLYVKPGLGEEVWLRASEFAKASGTSISALVIELLAEHLCKYPGCTCGATLNPKWKHCPTCGTELR